MGFKYLMGRRLAFCNLFTQTLLSFRFWFPLVILSLTSDLTLFSFNRITWFQLREEVKSQREIGQFNYLFALCVVNASKGLCKIKARRIRCNEGRCKTSFSLSYYWSRNTNAKMWNIFMYIKTMYSFLLFHEKVQSFWER